MPFYGALINLCWGRPRNLIDKRKQPVPVGTGCYLIKQILNGIKEFLALGTFL